VHAGHACGIDVLQLIRIEHFAQVRNIFDGPQLALNNQDVLALNDLQFRIGEDAFKISGNAYLTVNFGGIQVNSTDQCAVRGVGTPTLDAVWLYVTGDVCVNNNVLLPPNTVTGVPPIDDPLADIPEPAWDEASDLGAIEASGYYTPGYYSGGVDLTGGDVTLLPGIYVLDGAGLQVGGNANFIAEGVTSQEYLSV